MLCFILYWFTQPNIWSGNYYYEIEYLVKFIIFTEDLSWPRISWEKKIVIFHLGTSEEITCLKVCPSEEWRLSCDLNFYEEVLITFFLFLFLDVWVCDQLRKN